MDKYCGIREHIEHLKKDENYIEYFKEFALEKLQTNPEYVKEVMTYLLGVVCSLGYKTAEHWCIVYLGWYENIINNFAEAINLHWKANQFFEDTRNKKGIIVTCNALLSDYSIIGQFNLSIKSGLRGIELARQIKDEDLLTALLCNVASVYVQNKNYDEALKSIERLLSYNYKLRNSDKSLINGILAECELHFKNFDKAYEHIMESLQIINENNFMTNKAETLSIKAQISHKLGNEVESTKDFQESISLSIENEDKFFMAITLLKWSQCIIEIGRYDEAEIKLLQAKKELESFNIPTIKCQIYNELNSLYKKMERYKEACEAMDEYCKCQEEISKYNNSTWFTILKYYDVSNEAKEYKDLYDKIHLISEMGKKITSNLDIEEIMKVIYTEVDKLLSTDVFGIALYEEENDALNYKLFLEHGAPEDYGKAAINKESTIGAYCFKNREEVLINDLTTEYSKYIDGEINSKSKVNSIIYIPIIINNNVIGVMSAQSYKKNAYTENDVNELKILGSYIAIALENGRLFNKIQYFANHDALTDVENRSKIIKTGVKVLESAKIFNKKLSVMMLDIDHFKKINDTYGHHVGDEALKNISSIIKNNIRSTDFLGRYGGEEFLVILPSTNLRTAKIISERIREAVETYEYYTDDGVQINATVSLGIYEFQDYNISFFEGIKRADKALYIAKNLGRNISVDYREG